MTRRTRDLLVGLTMTGLVAAGRPSMAAEVEPPAISHVRSSNPSIMAPPLSWASSDSTSRRSASSPAHASRRYTARAPGAHPSALW